MIEPWLFISPSMPEKSKAVCEKLSFEDLEEKDKGMDIMDLVEIVILKYDH